MEKIGAMIVFEGPDGTGKSSLAQALHHYLLAQNQSWNLLAFPGNEKGTLGSHVYALHHRPQGYSLSRIHPESLQLLHIAAHIDSIETRIKPALKLNKNILLDRFWWSTWVYGLNSGVDPQALEKMIELEVYHWQEILPSMVIWVDRQLPLKTGIDQQMWQKLREGYSQLVKKEKDKYPIYLVENNTAFNDAFAKVVELVEKYMQTPRIKNTTANPIREDNLPEQIKDQTGQQLLFPFASVNKQKGAAIPAKPPDIFPVIPTKVYDTYWRFAAERQSIFFKRFEGCPQPWTTDLILSHYKFTNAYRASDRVSQYLIKNVIYKGKQAIDELFFRIMLYKVFNRISTWELLVKEFGEVSLTTYSFDRYDQVLTQAIKKGTPIFSAAYIMPSGGKNSDLPYKHQTFLRLIERMLTEKLPARLAAAHSMKAAFEMLRSYPLLGDFLAYQYVIDLNYSIVTNFSESEFVIPGPGARDGLRKCFANFGGLNEIELIRLVTDRQEEEFARLGIDFQSLWGRRLQLIDCQNLFCEVDKYARVAHPDVEGVHKRTRIKQIYKSEHTPIDYWYPPKWGINQFIKEK